MHNALKNCRKVIAILTPDYMKSNWCLKESLTALAWDVSGKENRLIPVRVLPCKPEGLLKTRIYIDLVGIKEAEKVKEVLLLKIKGSIKERLKPEKEPVLPATEHIPGFPGFIPEIWNIPHRNPHFTGRNKEINELHTFLNDENTAVLSQAITGLGGIGKTQLALEYAHRYKSNYFLIWWIHAEVSTSLETDYRSLAKQLGYDVKEDTPIEDIIRNICKVLEHRHNWLLIFDNAIDEQSIISHLPREYSGHIIITSRNRHWSRIGKNIDIKVLPRKDSVAFLLDRTGLNDPVNADKLAETLGDLPLALEQAAAYIISSMISYKDYLLLFIEERKKPPTEYHATAATTWSISIAKISPAGN